MEFKRQTELASQISNMVPSLQQFVNDHKVPNCLWDTTEILQVFTNNNNYCTEQILAFLMAQTW